MIRAFLTVIVLVFAPAARAEVKIQEVTSPGGITAWLVEDHTIPFTAMEILFKGGASLDAPGKRGAINLMTGLIEEGAGDLDARGFAQAREGLAASFGFDVYDDSLSVSAKFLTENRDAAVDLLRAALIDPRFDQDAIDRVRAQVISIIRSEEKDQNDIAGTVLDQLAWGDHPYGSSSNGTVESVTALTRDDIFDARARVMTRDRVYVGVVGDITPQDLAPLLDHLLGELPETGAPLPQGAEMLMGPGVTIVPFDSPQSVAVFGHQGIKRDDEDFFAAFILNTIMGSSGFESRLMQEVREKRGLTYGISSFLVPKDYGELYLGSFSSSNDRIAGAIKVIRDEWTRMATEGVTEEELDRTKTYLTGAYPLRFSGNGPIANIMVGMQIQDLPIDYIETRNDKLNAVTLDEVNAMAQRLLKPDELHFIVVGQPEGLEPSN
jgi:zinc protease